MSTKELKAILNIIPQDNLTRMKVCDAVEQFRRKHPREYAQVMERY